MKWFPKYKKNYFFNDAIAGITVGLTVVPQSMGFAALAGLTPEVINFSCYSKAYYDCCGVLLICSSIPHLTRIIEF